VQGNWKVNTGQQNSVSITRCSPINSISIAHV